MRKLIVVADGTCMVGTYDSEQEYASVYDAIKVASKDSHPLGVRELRKLAFFGPQESHLKLQPTNQAVSFRVNSIILSLDLNEESWRKFFGDKNGKVVFMRKEKA